jgi:Holliday junction resolvase RusA-like endonuclease
MLTITIPGEMRGKGRPRFSARGGFARAYTDSKTANAEAWVKHCAMTQAGTAPIEGAVSIAITIDVVPPASWAVRKKANALAGAFFPTSKPDLDNIAKLIADALNGIVWRDDKQIVRMVLAKRYAPTAQAVLTVVEV